MLIKLGTAPFDYELDFTIPEVDNECYSCIEAATGFSELGKTRPEFLEHD